MATRAKTGFDVRCPRCADEDAIVSIDLHDLDVCRCSSCDNEFSPREARELVAGELAKWDAILKWIDLAAGCLADAK